MKGLTLFFSLAVLWRSAFSESCITPLKRQSDCVSIYDCPQLLTPFEQRPLPNHVINFLRQSQCGFEGYIPRVCCGPIPPAPGGQTPTKPPGGTSLPRPIEGEDPVYEEDSYPESRDKCGLETGADRIYGGQFTELDEFPWMALLGYRPRNNGPLTYQCGGVLINHRYILSAAHCVVGEIEKAVGKLTSARLGEYDTQTDIDCAEPNDCADPPQEILVHSSYPNPGFSDRNKNRQDDIAVIRLARRAAYTTYVQPICLIDNRIRLSAGDDVFVAGWGKTLEGKSSPIKLKLNVPIFTKSECVSKYRTLGADLTDNQLCAGGVFAQDACRGDSGGPLMRKTPSGTWETVAVVSFGYGCGRDGWPGVYTSVSHYIDWIRDVMASSNV
ncbi:phenoloxidase-activating enzyme 1-like [Maniola jurtina]|uniref:phenoloxidase-activating enzyme 1-like n=1 Tax=Maniola jurtina TaxID=191418 RepID=UPI001E68AF7D|nr:phenoloxidase-activating enzyme 1-like [Maniola jurtina]